MLAWVLTAALPLLAAAATSAGRETPDPPLELAIGGENLGRFAALEFGDGVGEVAVTLRDGALAPAFFALWGGEAGEPEALRRPGAHELDAASCRPRAVTLTQTVGAGRRARARAWTLLGACPRRWRIADAAPRDDGALAVEELELRAAELAAAL